MPSITPRITRLCAAAVVLTVTMLTSFPAAAAVVMRIDTENNVFYMEGTDSGNARFEPNPIDPSFSTYDLQFLHTFATQPSASASITNTPQNLFVQGATLPISGGNMNMIRSTFSDAYVFIDLSASSDITTLTGKGSSETVSYASLPAADQALFESMIGQTMSLTTGTGYSPISVQAVPEPSVCITAVAGLAAGGYSLFHLRKRG